MDNGQQEQPSEPIRCAAGCGFFGNVATENMCSKCFRDRNGDAAPAQPAPVTPVAPITTAEVKADIQPKIESVISHALGDDASAKESTAESSDPDAPPSAKKKKKKRCVECKKKVGLLGFTCRCEGLYCTKHKNPVDHSCAFDFKEFGKEVLTKANPACVADKIQKL